MALGRRFPFSPPQLAPLVRPPTAEEAKKGKSAPTNTGLWSEESFAALQRFLRDIFSSVEGGLPPGHSTITPANIKAGESGLPGSPETGWATGSHQHEILTDTAIQLSPSTLSIEGTGEGLARADHHHSTVQLANAVEMMIDLRV